MALAPNTKLLKCADCGKGQPRVTNVYSRDLRTGERRVSHVWLCADCEYMRDHPGALPAVPMPNERRAKRLQKETLF